MQCASGNTRGLCDDSGKHVLLWRSKFWMAYHFQNNFCSLQSERVESPWHTALDALLQVPLQSLMINQRTSPLTTRKCPLATQERWQRDRHIAVTSQSPAEMWHQGTEYMYIFKIWYIMLINLRRSGKCIADGSSAYERQVQTHLSSKGHSYPPSLSEFILWKKQMAGHRNRFWQHIYIYI